MKKLTALAALALSLALLAGCGGTPPADGSGSVGDGKNATGTLITDTLTAPVTEEEARERFDYLAVKYPAWLLTQEDPASFYPGSYYFYRLGGEPLYDGELSGASAEYLTEAERETLGKPEYWFMVYSDEQLQKGADDIWGEGAADVSSWLRGDDASELDRMCYHTEAGYFFVTGGMGDDGIMSAYKTAGFKADKDEAALTARCINYNLFDGMLYDMSSDGDRSFTGPLIELVSGEPLDFDVTLKVFGIDEAELGTIDFIFYRTEAGLRLQKAARHPIEAAEPVAQAVG